MSEQDFVAYGLPLIEEDDIDGVVDSLRSGWLTCGPKTQEFERQFAEFAGAKYAIALNSCTSGQHLGLVAADIGEGDEVITTPMTFVSTVNTIVHTGAKPVMVDIDPGTMNIDAGRIESAITERTKAIVPVHIAGYPCDMDEILALADTYELMVLEDAAHALYTQYKGRMVGAIGDATVFSFNAAKNLVTGEGGMITTDNEELAERLRLASNHGINNGARSRCTARGTWRYEVLYPGYKYAMTDIQASLGLSQLKKLSYMQTLREIIAQRYNEAFARLPEIELPADAPHIRHAWHLYIIKLNLDMLTVDRTQFVEGLKERGVGAGVHFIPVHLHPYYKQICGYQAGEYPQAEQVFERILSLPLYPKMTNRDVEKVIAAVTGLVKRYRR